MTLYVGNLNHQVNEGELTTLFSEFGEVKSVKIIKDNETGRPRGFAFVEMNEESAADSAISALHEKEFRGRPLVVNQAKPKTAGGPGGDRPRTNRFSNSGGGGYSGGGNSGGGGYNRGGNSGGGSSSSGGGGYNRSSGGGSSSGGSGGGFNRGGGSGGGSSSGGFNRSGGNDRGGNKSGGFGDKDRGRNQGKGGKPGFGDKEKGGGGRKNFGFDEDDF